MFNTKISHLEETQVPVKLCWSTKHLSCEMKCLLDILNMIAELESGALNCLATT